MEHILTPKVENVKLVDKYNPRNSPMGTLYLTTTHLIFVSYNEQHLGRASSTSTAVASAGSKKELWILHMLMHTVERPSLTTSGSQFRVICHNFQTATFIVPKERDASSVVQSLCNLSKPKDINDLYCFSYNPKGEIRQNTGWNFHDLQAEFQRQGVPNSNWSFCQLNENYKLCPTYPKVICVPACASRDVVEGSAEFRSKRRLPVLTYLHKNNAAIIRCAQPMVGISGVRSQEDEAFVNCLLRATPGTTIINVIDTRPAMNAMANRAGGKGYENEKYYENINFCFRGIENIHQMRKSLRLMMTSIASSTSMENFLGELSSSGWLKHIKAVLETSVEIMKSILDKRSVVVHCSDGWDRTAQTCSLACLMLDGYYRTTTGFQALIEKDWLAFGHKFTDRLGQIDGNPEEVSPTFAQFLDCTWQLFRMHPQAFQFNERFLITIHECAYSSQFGTFLGNCEREREALGLKDKTFSLWGYLVANHDEYLNPLYDRGSHNNIIQPCLAPQNIIFWTGLYCRFESAAQPRENLIDLLSVTQNQTSSLGEHSRQLSKTLGHVTQLITNSKASGAMRKMLPSSPNKEPPPPAPKPEIEQAIEAETMEKKFTDLKTSLVEKCQSSFVSMMMLPTMPILTQSPARPKPKADIPQIAKEVVETSRPLPSPELIDKAEILAMLDSVAVDWQPLRNCNECRCGSSLEMFKVHCRRCGNIVCRRCSLFKAKLAGHFTEKKVSICNTCHRELNHSVSESVSYG